MIKALIDAFREGFREYQPKRLRADGQPVHVETSTATPHRQSVAATVVRACVTCGAPGVWTCSQEVQDNWLGVYVTDTCNAKGYPVGDRCPNCGSPRKDEVLGEIWVKETR